jgi:hypothetical protein
VEATAVRWAEFCLHVTRYSFTKYTRQSGHRLGTTLPSLLPHIILVVSLSLLIQRECAHTGPQDRGSVLMQYGRGREAPRGVSAAEPPCQANASCPLRSCASRISYRYSFSRLLDRLTNKTVGRGADAYATYFFLEYTM